MSWITVADARAFLGLADDADTNTLLESLITSSQQAIVSYLSHPVALGTYTQIFDIPEFTDYLLPENYPIVSVVALTDSTTAWDTSYYYVTSDQMLIRTIPEGRYFYPGRQTVQLTYAAGWEPIPADITLALKKIVGMVYAGKDNGPYRRESQGDYSYEVMNSIYDDPLVNGLLRQYKRISD